ncbi:ABC transporter ATP-binding protein [Nocardioides caldifontis]|uniref:ABC transporter ATP-binding protein n=1 Tax=Nocardioides caldifontis TaxID=2588938 RepID=UPI0011DF1902|nr:ABC transporter ATP-binding protein [Nocardioides caldifontis]
MLRTERLVKEFRGFRAVGGKDGVDLAVREGETHALVGPNGAGKTTLFNLLSGALAPSSGRIYLREREVTGLPAHTIARLGVARSFQVSSVFDDRTVRSHVDLTLLAHSSLRTRFLTSVRSLGAFAERTTEVLELVGLGHLGDRRAGDLAYGQKRALELAMVVAADPAVLLLDEPTAGMGTEDIERTIDLIQRIKGGRTIVLVEHNMKVVGMLADTVSVLQAGELIASGTYSDVRSDPRVVDAYLGAHRA